MVRAFLKASSRRKTFGVPYFTDASLFQWGEPNPGLWAWKYCPAHSKNEWVSLEEVEKAEDQFFDSSQISNKQYNI